MKRIFYNFTSLFRTHVKHNYVGAEAGVGLDYATGGGAFFNGAVELGAVINFRKVSLDLGIRAQFLPPFTLNSFLLPVKIGLVF